MIQMGNLTMNKRAEEYTPEPYHFARKYTVLVQIDMEFYFEPVHEPQEQHKIQGYGKSKRCKFKLLLVIHLAIPFAFSYTNIQLYFKILL
jgi:hypothetical protein